MADFAKAPRELREALGELVIASSAVEESLLDSILYLGGAPNQKIKLRISRAPLGRLVERFQELYEKRAAPVPGSQPVTGFCEHLNSLSDERTDLIHAMWMFESDVARRARIKQGGGGLRLDVESIYPDTVRNLAARFKGAEDKLWEFMVPLL